MVINGEHLLKIAPIKDMFAEKQKGTQVTFGMSEAGYDVRVAQDIHIGHKEIKPGAVDDVQICRFRLASTMEYFELPPNLMAYVHDKSSWARRGLQIFNTVIEPGWKGYLTLELGYFGQEPLFIPKGEGIAQIIFHEVSCPKIYTGRYNDQPNMPVGFKEV